MKIKTTKADKLSDALGLSGERYKELADHFRKVHRSSTADQLSEVLRDIVEPAETIEEAICLAFLFGRYHEHKMADMAKALSAFKELKSMISGNSD